MYPWSIIGHTHELQELERDIQEKTLSHAYLFAGPEGIGKTQIARTFAAILQCPNNFCRRCPTCIQVEKEIHQDTLVINNEEDSIKIQAVRDLVARVNLTGQSKYKIVIIEDIDRLTIEAANSLLKTLEEPPRDTIFIATVSNIKNLLPTLVSRMRVVTFKKPSKAMIFESLRMSYPNVPEEAIRNALALSFGAAGLAKQLIENPEKLLEIKKEYDEITFLFEHKKLAEAITRYGEIVKEDGHAKKFLERLLYFLHGKLHESVHDEATRLRIVDHLERTHKALELYEKNIHNRLLLEHLSLNLIH